MSFVAAVALLAVAQAPPILCGPDCSHPGRYVLCNDSFDTVPTATVGIRLEVFLESGCASFAPPAASFRLTGFVGLFGQGSMFFSLIQVYQEDGAANPGVSIDDNTGASIPSSSDTQFSGLYFPALTLTDDFRLCLRQQLEEDLGVRSMLFDADGASGRSWVFDFDNRWQDANPLFGGDLILRAVVEYNDLTPWEPGGSCDVGPQPDAGIPAQDSGTTMNRDASAPPLDSGTTIDPDDAGISVDEDAGVSTKPPPSLTSITPNRGLNTESTTVIALGTGFVEGLTLKIGAISADIINVPGPTTINAKIPPGIAAGTYDVLVQNPDGQAAILPQGFTVTGPDGDPGDKPGVAADQCGCRATPTSGSSAAWWIFLLAACARSRHFFGRSSVKKSCPRGDISSR
jgi:hypothetical protein